MMVDTPYQFPEIPLEERLRRKREQKLLELTAIDEDILRLHGLNSTFPAEDPGRRPPGWLTPAEALRRQKNTSQRFLTRIPSLDRATGGGIPRGRVIVIVGRPGTGKTTLCLPAVVGMAADGATVGILLQDEGLEPGVVRLAQRQGFPRDLLESADLATIEAAATKLDVLDHVHCLDPDLATASFDSFLTGMDTLAGERPQVWLLDSAQVIRMAATGGKEERMKVKGLLEAVKSEARRRGAVVFLISQSNRASYRSKRTEENSDPLTAGAESASIEFMADVLIFLSPDGEDRTKVQLCKNRIGHLTTFHVALDRHRAEYREIDTGALMAEEEAENHIKRDKDVKGWCQRVVAVLEKHPEGLTGSQIREISGLNGAKLNAAKDALESVHRVSLTIHEGKGGGVKWTLIG